MTIKRYFQDLYNRHDSSSIISPFIPLSDEGEELIQSTDMIPYSALRFILAKSKHWKLRAGFLKIVEGVHAKNYRILLLVRNKQFKEVIIIPMSQLFVVPVLQLGGGYQLITESFMIVNAKRHYFTLFDARAKDVTVRMYNSIDEHILGNRIKHANYASITAHIRSNILVPHAEHKNLFVPLLFKTHNLYHSIGSIHLDPFAPDEGELIKQYITQAKLCFENNIQG